MITAILHFARLCRASGLRVSTSEVLSAIRHVRCIDLADEEQFHAALKANFVKSRSDEDRFEEIYDLYVRVLQMGAALKQTRSLSQRLIELVSADEAGGEDNGVFPDLPADRRAALIRELLKLLDMDLDVPEISLADLSAAAGEGAETPLDPARGTPGERGMRIGAEERRMLEELLEERLAAVLRTDEEGRCERLPAGPASGRSRVRTADLGEVPFIHLTEEEAREVHKAIERLARKLRDRVANRYRRKREGLVDVKDTLRLAIRHEAVPLEIRYRRRQPRKQKIVALCDVSYSVWQAVPFMLNILYSLQDCLSRVRSFVFIASVADVSGTMEDHDVLRAVDRVMADYRLRMPRNAVYGDPGDRVPEDHDPEISDYGQALARFTKDHLDILDPKTTLIILGDGRTNYLDPRADLLEGLKERCRRVVWLNPEPESLWGDGDSAIPAYRPHCSEVRPCRNLNELGTFISTFVM